MIRKLVGAGPASECQSVMPPEESPSPTVDNASRALFRFTILRVILQWIGVLAILFAMITWIGLPQWTRAIALLLSIAIMVELLRVEAAIRLRDVSARVTKMQKEYAAQSRSPEA